MASFFDRKDKKKNEEDDLLTQLEKAPKPKRDEKQSPSWFSPTVTQDEIDAVKDIPGKPPLSFAQKLDIAAASKTKEEAKKKELTTLPPVQQAYVTAPKKEAELARIHPDEKTIAADAASELTDEQKTIIKDAVKEAPKPDAGPPGIVSAGIVKPKYPGKDLNVIFDEIDKERKAGQETIGKEYEAEKARLNASRNAINDWYENARERLGWAELATQLATALAMYGAAQTGAGQAGVDILKNAPKIDWNAKIDQLMRDRNNALAQQGDVAAESKSAHEEKLRSFAEMLAKKEGAATRQYETDVRKAEREAAEQNQRLEAAAAVANQRNLSLWLHDLSEQKQEQKEKDRSAAANKKAFVSESNKVITDFGDMSGGLATAFKGNKVDTAGKKQFIDAAAKLNIPNATATFERIEKNWNIPFTTKRADMANTYQKDLKKFRFFSIYQKARYYEQLDPSSIDVQKADALYKKVYNNEKIDAFDEKEISDLSQKLFGLKD